MRFPTRFTLALALAAGTGALLPAPAAAQAVARAQRDSVSGCTLSGDLLRAPVDSQARRSSGPRTTAPAESTGVAGQPALVVYAAVRARSVRFAKQPEIRVRLCGALDSVHVVARENLPTPVAAGTTYQNVYVAVQILGRLNARCLADHITGQRQPADSGSACASLSLVMPRDSARTPRDSLRR